MRALRKVCACESVYGERCRPFQTLATSADVLSTTKFVLTATTPWHPRMHGVGSVRTCVRCERVQRGGDWGTGQNNLALSTDARFEHAVYNRRWYPILKGLAVPERRVGGDRDVQVLGGAGDDYGVTWCDQRSKGFQSSDARQGTTFVVIECWLSDIRREGRYRQQRMQ